MALMKKEPKVTVVLSRDGITYSLVYEKYAHGEYETNESIFAADSHLDIMAAGIQLVKDKFPKFDGSYLVKVDLPNETVLVSEVDEDWLERKVADIVAGINELQDCYEELCHES